MLKAFEIPLYHGTISRIDAIDLSKGRPHKDFGQGFYMALTASQAIAMMHKKLKEAVRRTRNGAPKDFTERLYRIRLRPAAEQKLRIKVFTVADLEWLDFVLAGRAGISHDYDIVIGPTADDDTIISLRNYNRGVYGPVGSPEAKRALLNVLEPENLGVQVCICKQGIVPDAVLSFDLVDWRRL